MFCSLRKHRKAVEANTAALLELAKAVRNLSGPPMGTDPFELEILGVNGMSIQARLKLPQIPAGTPEGEVVSGKATLVVNGVETVYETVPGQEYVEGLTFEQEDQVVGTFTFIDNNGNDSDNPKSFTTQLDTVGVDPEGDFGLEVVPVV